MTIYTDQYGVTKYGTVPQQLPPSDKVSPNTLASGHAARGAGGLPGVSGGVGNTQGFDPSKVDLLPGQKTGGANIDYGDLLKDLGLGVGGAGLLFGAYKGAGALLDKFGPDLSGVMSGTRTDGGITIDPKEAQLVPVGKPGPYIRTPPTTPDVINVPPSGKALPPGSPQKLLPPPQAQITDQRAGRFNQSAPTQQRYLTDGGASGRNAAAVKGGQVDSAYAANEAAKAAEAAKAEMAMTLAQKFKVQAIANSLRRIVP